MRQALLGLLIAVEHDYRSTRVITSIASRSAAAPPIQTVPFGESLSAFACSPRHMGVDEINIATQCYTSNHVWIDGDRMVPADPYWDGLCQSLERPSG